MNTIIGITAAALLTFAASASHAAGWSLSAEDSKVAFGSIKKDKVGEVHHFSGLAGSVGEDGMASVEIDVTTLETWIDIRNERMLNHVFNAEKFPKVKISAQIDMDDVAKLAPGESETVTTEATLSFAGHDLNVETDLFVLAVGGGKVLVTTDEMLMVSAEELQISAGIDKLMELAKLPSITRTSPVTLRLMFTKN